jgi:hypothetical protein
MVKAVLLLLPLPFEEHPTYHKSYYKTAFQALFITGVPI